MKPLDTTDKHTFLNLSVVVLIFVQRADVIMRKRGLLTRVLTDGCVAEQKHSFYLSDKTCN